MNEALIHDLMAILARGFAACLLCRAVAETAGKLELGSNNNLQPIWLATCSR